jgi:hypothetical protein
MPFRRCRGCGTRQLACPRRAPGSPSGAGSALPAACAGAVPRTHAHFFTEDGLFGSLDWNGDQVDDGTYELVGDDTFVVSKEFPDVTFHYVIDGDTIAFEPVIPECSPRLLRGGLERVGGVPG